MKPIKVESKFKYNFVTYLLFESFFFQILWFFQIFKQACSEVHSKKIVM